MYAAVSTDVAPNLYRITVYSPAGIMLPGGSLDNVEASVSVVNIPGFDPGVTLTAWAESMLSLYNTEDEFVEGIGLFRNDFTNENATAGEKLAFQTYLDILFASDPRTTAKMRLQSLGDPDAPLHVGNRAGDPSEDSVILVNRFVDDTVATNGHAFSDGSEVDRPGHISYNSYDVAITVGGAEDYGHFAGFQANPTFGGSGLIDDYYGAFIGRQGAQEITNAHGIWVNNISNHSDYAYAFYAAAQFQATTENWAFYSASFTKSQLGVTHFKNATGGFDGAVTVGAAGSGYGAVAYNADMMSDGTYEYITGDVAALIDFEGGRFRVRSAASGVAGNPITFATVLETDASGNLLPGVTSTQDLGSAGKQWDNTYLVNAPIVSSDRKLKTDIRGLGAAEVRAAKALGSKLCLYKLKSAVEAKGVGARTHVGIIAQDVIATLAAEGLNAFDYGFVGEDEMTEERPVLDEGGDPVMVQVSEKRPAEYRGRGKNRVLVSPEIAAQYRPKVAAFPTGEKTLSVRYEELTCFVLAGLCSEQP